MLVFILRRGEGRQEKRGGKKKRGQGAGGREGEQEQKLGRITDRNSTRKISLVIQKELFHQSTCCTSKFYEMKKLPLPICGHALPSQLKCVKNAR